MVQLAIPSIIAQLINVLYNIIDRMYVGHIPEVGANALTGLGVSAPIMVYYSEPIADIISASVSGILLFISMRQLKTLSNSISL